jgi:hypothetical protein
LKRPDNKTLYAIIATLLAWGLIGWILISLRNSNGLEQIASSTLLLRILCAGASLLLLLTCIVVSIGLGRIARDTEAEQKFPPAAAAQFGTVGSAEGEQAWMWAARLRGWAAFTLVLGLAVAGTGIGITLRAIPLPVVPPAGMGDSIRSAPVLVQGRQSTPLPTPGRSTGAPG